MVENLGTRTPSRRSQLCGKTHTGGFHFARQFEDFAILNLQVALSFQPSGDHFPVLAVFF